MDFDREHEAKEIVPGLILGGLRDLRQILAMEPEVLAPLDRLPGEVWESGFRGEILYYPITDLGVLPDEVLDKLVRELLERLKAGKRIALFCAGGHGRTGYVAACLLYLLGREDPVAYLRRCYSAQAVETDRQAEAVLRFCRRHWAERGDGLSRMIRSVRLTDPEAALRDPGVLRTMERIRDQLGENGRILIRRSGVLPEICVMLEAPNEELCAWYMEDVLSALERTGLYLGWRPELLD